MSELKLAIHSKLTLPWCVTERCYLIDSWLAEIMQKKIFKKSNLTPLNMLIATLIRNAKQKSVENLGLSIVYILDYLFGNMYCHDRL